MSAGVDVAESSGVVLENLTIESGWARRGCAVAVRGGSFRMKYCTLEGNYARLRGGGLYAEEVNGASYVHNVVVRGNIVGTVNGGTDVTNFRGGAIFVERIEERLSFHNVLAYYNQAGVGGALYIGPDPGNPGADPGTTWSNCTFAGNKAYFAYQKLMGGGWSCSYAGLAGGVYVETGGNTHELRNSIVWGNVSPPIAPDDMVVNGGPLQLVVEHCDVFTTAAGAWPGTGNIDADPQFVSPGTEDFHIAFGSPAMDAGSNAAVPNDHTDLDDDGDFGEQAPWSLEKNIPRIMAGIYGQPVTVDMGAYEVRTTVPL